MSKMADSETGVAQDPLPYSPQVSQQAATELLEQHFDFHVNYMKELYSYDDKNFHFKVSNSGKDIFPDGYVLKILNTRDSDELRIDGVNQLMIHINETVIPTCIPILNKEGKDKFLMKFNVQSSRTDDEDTDLEAMFLVRVLKFIPGTLLTEITYTREICHHSGMMAAKVHKSLANFTHAGLETTQLIWSLQKAPEVRKYLCAVPDQIKHNLFLEVIEKFEQEVLGNLEQLRPGIVHGDLNEHNILVSKADGKNEYEWSGLIDFGESHMSYQLFDLAQLMAYLMQDSKKMDSIDVGGHILAGYLKICHLSQVEFDLLMTCIKGRLVQSLTMAYHSFQHHPENRYILSTVEGGWRLLQRLSQVPEQDTIMKWKVIINGYQMKVPQFLSLSE